MYAAGCADGAAQLVCPAHALVWARDTSSDAYSRASGNLDFLRSGSIERFKGSNESGRALALKARLAQWILQKKQASQLEFEKTEVLTSNDHDELEVVRRTDLCVDGHRYEVETLLGSGPIEAFYQQKVFARLQKDKTPLSVVVPSEAFLWAGPYLGDLAYHLSDRGKVLLPGMDRAFLQVKPRALRELVPAPEVFPWENMPPIGTWKTDAAGSADSDAQIKLVDVKGYDDIKRQVDELITYPEKNRRVTKALRTSGILFFGPPGCGKSRLARAIAGELEQEVRLLGPADLRGAYISWGQIMIREQFDWVAGNERRMLVIDELDAVARSRRNHGNMHTDEMADVNELLVQLDRVSRLGRIVAGTTNYVASLDDAVVRSGRFGRFIPVPPPDLDAASEIVEFYLKQVTAPGGDGELRVDGIAGNEVRAVLEAAMRECELEQRFYCGADLEEAVNRTHQRCCRKAMPEGWPKDARTPAIVLTADDLHISLHEVRKSIDKDSVHDFLEEVDRFCPRAVAAAVRASMNLE